MDIAVDKIKAQFDRVGYPRRPTPAEIKQAWMRGRNLPKSVGRPAPVSQPRTIRAPLPLPLARAEVERLTTAYPAYECKTAKYQSLLRWRIKNGYRPLRGGHAGCFWFRDWSVLKFIAEELGGPVCNIKSCLDPSIMVQYEARLYMAKARAKPARK
jgi:hypothetical protein